MRDDGVSRSRAIETMRRKVLADRGIKKDQRAFGAKGPKPRHRPNTTA
jgi:hypothetical protein